MSSYITALIFIFIKKDNYQIKILSPKLLIITYSLLLILNFSFYFIVLSESYSKSFFSLFSSDLLVFNSNILLIVVLLIQYLRLKRIINVFLLEEDDDDNNIIDLEVKQSNKLADTNKKYMDDKSNSSRSSALYKDSFTSTFKKKQNNIYYYLKERSYMNIIIPMCIVTFSLFTFYQILSYLEIINKNKNEISIIQYLFPVWIQIKNLEFSKSNEVFSLLIICLILIVYYLIFSTSFTLYFKVNTPSKAHIKSEPLLTSLLLITIDMIVRAIGLSIKVQNYSSINVYLILVSLMYMILTVTSCILVFISLKEIFHVEIYNKEVATDFNLLMLSETGHKYFYSFLKEYDHNVGSKMLEFYTELIIVKSLNDNFMQCNLKKDDEESSFGTNETREVSSLNQKLCDDNDKTLIGDKYNAFTLYNKYLDYNSSNYISFPQSLVQNLYNSYTKSTKNSFSIEWNGLLEYIYHELRTNYYEKFTQSFKYQMLTAELKSQETTFNKLVIASVIEEY